MNKVTNDQGDPIIGFTVRLVEVVHYGKDKTKIPYCVDFHDDDDAYLIGKGFVVTVRKK